MADRLSWMDGVMSTCGGEFRLTNRTFLQTEASHTPSPLLSYFDLAISFLARPASPASFGVWYGSKVSPPKFSTVGGMMCVAMSPCGGPPHACCSACLSM